MRELSDTQKKLEESERQRIYYVDMIKKYEQIIEELKDKNTRLLSENKKLKEELNTTLDDQQSRIDSITKIAQKERKNLYVDIINLMNDEGRFSLDSLLEYSTSEWLSKRNPVIVKFIETLIFNENQNQHEDKKLFKCAMVVNGIYGARHAKYVSEINLVASAIKYSLARSKTVINIDNHLTSGGSYFYFQKWLEELSDIEEALPNGLLFIAFDNEQKGQKNYLDRGFNKVIFHIVTSFVAFNMEPCNETQHINNPWVYNSLNEQQYKELFELSPEMQEEIDKELYTYLSEILGLLCKEKSNSTNVIDVLVENNESNNRFSKYCPNCNEQNIQNRKQNCPSCNAKLPTLGELQKQNIIEEDNTPDNYEKSFIFKSHNFESESRASSTSRISITQQPVADSGVKVPDIYIPDPLNINPNSIDNVEKILLHIEKISGIKEGIRKWVAVACDGVPYHHATKIKEKFPWLILVPGQLHEEMNMLRAYVELNW